MLNDTASNESAQGFCVSAHEILRDLHAAHTGVAEFDSWMGVVLGTLGWVADKKSNHDEFVSHMDQAIRFQRDAVEKRPRHQEYKARLQGHHEFFVARLLAAMEGGFKTDISESRFDPIRDDAKFQEAIERLETSLPDDGPVGVVAE